MFFFSSRRRHTRCSRDWSSDVCSSDLYMGFAATAQGAYSSGHPAPESGLTNPFGLIRSRDGGKTWDKLGLEGESDFHRSEEHTSELQSRLHLVCRLLLEKKHRYNHHVQ